MDQSGGGRDEEGRVAPGASGNPAGRPGRGDYARLLQAAERVGAEVVVMVPPRAPRRPRPLPDHLPPAA